MVLWSIFDCVWFYGLYAIVYVMNRYLTLYVQCGQCVPLYDTKCVNEMSEWIRGSHHNVVLQRDVSLSIFCDMYKSHTESAQPDIGRQQLFSQAAEHYKW